MLGTILCRFWAYDRPDIQRTCCKWCCRVVIGHTPANGPNLSGTTWLGQIATYKAISDALTWLAYRKKKYSCLPQDSVSNCTGITARRGGPCLTWAARTEKRRTALCLNSPLPLDRTDESGCYCDLLQLSIVNSAVLLSSTVHIVCSNSGSL